MVLIKSLMFILSLIIIFIGFYLRKHQKQDFMLFKPNQTKGLPEILNTLGIVLMITGVIVLILGIMGNTYILLAAMVFGILITTSCLLFLIKFL